MSLVTVLARHESIEDRARDFIFRHDRLDPYDVDDVHKFMSEFFSIEFLRELRAIRDKAGTEDRVMGTWTCEDVLEERIRELEKECGSN